MPTDLPSDQIQNPLTPEVTWAQRSSNSDAAKNFIYLTIAAPDVPQNDMKLDIKPGSVTFEGYSNSKKARYRVVLELYAEIDPSESKINHSERDIEMKLQKKDLKEEYWPRLLNEPRRAHFLKTDFDKWVDEDEQDGVADDDYMNQFGGMQGMGGDGGFGGLDFSKLGGGAGGMPDLGDLGGAGEDDSDDELPDLDDEDAVGANGSDQAKSTNVTSKGMSSKIEEVE